ncbi:MAG: hypothetical protein AAFO91_08915, partial [Bacteroidota bacterium]
MYQVVLAALVGWVIVTVPLSLSGLIPYSLLELAALLAVLFVSSVLVHEVCRRITGAPANLDSTLITALILFFLFTPSVVWADLSAAAIAAALAIVSKYLLAYRHLHILNPVAFGALAIGLFGVGYASWWVATPWLFPFVLVGGTLIAVKIRRLDMVLYGVAAAAVFSLLIGWQNGDSIADVFTFFLLSSPIIFFFTVMVTEPLSTPGQAIERAAYGVVIGVLYSVPFSFGPFFTSPELALVVANLLFYPTTLRERLTLPLREVQKVAKD